MAGVYHNVVLFCTQRAPSELSAHQKKITAIDKHVGMSIAGLTADARLLRYRLLCHILRLL